MQDIKAKAKLLFEFTRSLRRDFHQHPELGFNEYRTSGIVANELTKLGLDVTTGIGKTGVVALLRGALPGPVILLRFDMDALPIQEENEVEYASCEAGIMHACGHDAHTAIGLAVAKILSDHKEQLKGTVKFMFQPAEEGLGGAEAMIADGVLANPKPAFALAVHVWNDKPLGWLGISPGPVMAAAEAFTITIIGKGGHGALPNMTIDPILAASYMINGLQSIVSRNVSPLKTAVVSVTAIQGGEAFNVIPSSVCLKGTIRTFDTDVRERVLSRFQEIIEKTASAMECTVEIDLKSITPALINDEEVTQLVINEARTLFPDADLATEYQTMGSEDMAYVLNQIPGCYVFMGSVNPTRGKFFPHHHPRFDIDEDVLPNAVTLIASTTLSMLSSGISKE